MFTLTFEDDRNVYQSLKPDFTSEEVKKLDSILKSIYPGGGFDWIDCNEFQPLDDYLMVTYNIGYDDDDWELIPKDARVLVAFRDKMETLNDHGCDYIAMN